MANCNKCALPCKQPDISILLECKNFTTTLPEEKKKVKKKAKKKRAK